MDLKKLTIVALLSSISIVLTAFVVFYVPFLGANNMRFTPGEIPIYIAGLLLGPGAGAAVGISSDLIRAIIFPAGPPFPGFTLSAATTGALPVILIKVFSKGNKKDSKLSMFLAVLITQIITGAVLNTLWLTMLYSGGENFKTYYISLFVIRLPFAMLLAVAYTLVLYPLRRILSAQLGNMGGNRG